MLQELKKKKKFTLRLTNGPAKKMIQPFHVIPVRAQSAKQCPKWAYRMGVTVYLKMDVKKRKSRRRKGRSQKSPIRFS